MSTKTDGGPAFPVSPEYRDHPALPRFLQYVDDGDGDLEKCWKWTGGRRRKGYGRFHVTHRKAVPAHRFAYELFYGCPPADLCLHSCDTPGCVNPTHLRSGSHGDNMKDMARRRRAAREERHHKAKLRRGEVLAIHCLASCGYTTRELARMLGVSQPTTSAILTGRLWPDVKTEATAMLAERDKQDD